MRVVIVALHPDSVAHRALTAEGVPHEEHVVAGDTGYGELLADLWAEGGFVTVEHDVVPWPGAVQQLLDCPGDWCEFRYPKGGSLTRGLGCTKLSDRLAREHTDLSARWRGVPWWELANVVLAAVSEVTGGKRCKHSPPVAHVRV